MFMFFFFYLICISVVFLLCVVCEFESPLPFTNPYVEGDSLLLVFLLLDDKCMLCVLQCLSHQPPLGGCYPYLARVRVELRDIARVMSLSVSLFRVSVGLKGLVMVILIPMSSVLVI